jgi:hypothetical protein
LLEYLRQHYGDLASVVGLMVSLVGFVATILGVRKAKHAAEDARKAAREAVARIKSQLLSDGIEISIRSFREVDRASRKQDWEVAADQCDEARNRLSRFLIDERLQEHERNTIQVSVDFLGAFLANIHKMSSASPPKALPPATSKQIHKAIIGLGRIQGRLQSMTFEV